MLAMQYRIGLPADYDMEIIRTRVRERGHMTDAFPGLALKAYCVSDAGVTGQANAYAPFYLWHETDGTAQFVFGAPFAGIIDSFGRPSIEHGLVLTQRLAPPSDSDPTWATIERSVVDARTDLAQLSDAEDGRCSALADDSAVHAAASVIDPATWRMVRFTLWRERRDDEATEAYEVLHVSQPTNPR